MSRKFKNILIEPELQIKLMSYFLILFVLTSISFYSTSYFFFWRLRSKAVQVGIPEGHVFFNFLDNLKYDFDILFIVLALFNLILLIYFGFRVSHRIAGPFYKTKKYLSNIENEAEPFKLRKNDFFKDIEPVINQLKKTNEK